MNGTNGHVEAVSLPSARSYQCTDTILIQPPLSRRGDGPALVILIPDDISLASSPKTIDPPPLQKWAEEGYAVAQVTIGGHASEKIAESLRKAIAGLKELKTCSSTEKIGLISYNVHNVDTLSTAIDATKDIAAVIVYGPSHLNIAQPQQRHTSGPQEKEVADGIATSASFSYPTTPGNFFAIPSHPDFRPAPAAVAHTRCLTFLKPLTNGPHFDLEAIWEEHVKYEFAERAVEKTMGTMVQEPYVNHIPTITGGIGRAKLTDFYRHHFVFSNPADTALELVSRTVGVDRVIDEFVFSFTHDRVVDWILPGVPPTGKHVEIAFTSIVNVRGDRLFHEHIAWDQATVLRQLGLMPEYLPFPYALPDGQKAAEGKHFEYRVPTAGVETARKLVDESAVESNGMFEFAVREVDDV